MFYPCFRRAPPRTVQRDAAAVAIQDRRVARAGKTPNAYRLVAGPPSRSHQGTRTTHATISRQDVRHVRHCRAPQQNQRRKKWGGFVKKEEIELEHIQVPFAWRLCCNYPPLRNHRLILDAAGKPRPLSCLMPFPMS